jgi:hypothetical protein
MPSATTDRGAIIHFAGSHRMSPALDDRSRPAFSTRAGDGLSRCGWERFFAAMRAGGFALEFDPLGAASARLVPASEVRHEGERRATLLRAWRQAKLFWKAFVS